MKRILFPVIIALFVLSFLTTAVGANPADAKVYPLRWVYVSTGLETDKELARAEDITQTASLHGVNGMLLSAGFDSLDLKKADYLRRLQHLKQTCDRLGVEIIPLTGSVGYGGGVLQNDKNLAAGLPVKGALFVAGDRAAMFKADPSVEVHNAGFEEGLKDFTVRGGKATADSTEHHGGSASLRFDDLPKGDEETVVSQTLAVRPYRSYRFHCWAKSQGVGTASLLAGHAVAPDGRDLAYLERHFPADGEWHEYTGSFNSWYADHVDLQFGVTSGGAGKVWVDDLQVQEVGLMNVLRREGTPVVVRNEKTGEVYQEGRDYAPIADPHLDFQWTHNSPTIPFLSRTRIHKGDRLRVDYFHGTTIYRDQTPIDMSEPKVYEIWKAQIPLMEKYLAPKRYFLSMDEVRVGGFCDACIRRHLGMAQIMGDCLKRQSDMIRAANPSAEVVVWSDMFDPNHNALEKNYLINGDFRESWKYIPKDLLIACWYYEKRDQSLEHFSKLGYKTLGAAYYDGDDLENIKGWLASLDRTPGAVGIMYTTWENKYKLLPGFGDLVAKR